MSRAAYLWSQPVCFIDCNHNICCVICGDWYGHIWSLQLPLSHYISQLLCQVSACVAVIQGTSLQYCALHLPIRHIEDRHSNSLWPGRSNYPWSVGMGIDKILLIPMPLSILLIDPILYRFLWIFCVGLTGFQCQNAPIVVESVFLLLSVLL